ncbi:plasmid partitioning protein ParA [Candidatus Thiomargarita nelsonii]|uniref:Plasmid partitioning protein ParA n=1 Tax=Candidatus Thiomargarita nelsonii TaxID=1003181 RepID=A0A0A6PET6_9GAMM|nr:plasmid partitioning protein ParA [Candidatus Thiomargarita nelsonii]
MLKKSKQKFIFDPDYCHNEREVESKLIVSYLLPALGYSINSWRQEIKFNRFRLDFFAESSQTKNGVVIEAKHPDKNLNDHLAQLKGYMIYLDLTYGLLTNGKEIRIYKRATGNTIQLVFHCFAYGIENKIDEIRALIGRETLANSSNTDVNLKMTDVNMKIIAIYHNKGGVGKTTTVVNLAATFSKAGKKVLIIDLDSQANATFATGLVNFGDEEKDNLKDNYIYHLLKSRKSFSISDVARSSRFCSHTIDVIPSHILLMKHEKELNEYKYVQGILIKKLEEVKDKYDIVLIDTPPSLNLYAGLALITADYLLIPSDLKPFANEGLDNVREFLEETNEFREMTNRPPIQTLGVLPTKISTNAKFIKGTLQKRMALIKQHYQFEVMDSIIFEREDLAKCTEQTLEIGELEVADPRSIHDFKSHSKSVNEFQELAQEIMQKIGLSS